MPMIITAFITAVFTGGIFSFAQFLITRHDNKKNNPINSAVLALLRDRLLHLSERYLKDGELSMYEKQNLYELYKAYGKLGGNCFVKELVTPVWDLPIKE